MEGKGGRKESGLHCVQVRVLMGFGHSPSATYEFVALGVPERTNFETSPHGGLVPLPRVKYFEKYSGSKWFKLVCPTSKFIFILVIAYSI